jgi:hypothetical protein
VITVCEDEEDVLEDGREEALEERIARLCIGVSHVRDQLEAHRQTSTLNLAIIMLASPHAGIDDEFE